MPFPDVVKAFAAWIADGMRESPCDLGARLWEQLNAGDGG